jgi:hypothetical protein
MPAENRGGIFVKLFKREKPAPAAPAWPPEQYEPVIRSSICTGEKVACMRERATGKLIELMLLQDSGDLELFCRRYGVKSEDVKTVY